MKLVFERSEAIFETLVRHGVKTDGLQERVEADVPGSWVQLTYEHLRLAEDGDHAARYMGGIVLGPMGWMELEGWFIERGAQLSPAPSELDVMWPFSDVVVVA